MERLMLSQGYQGWWFSEGYRLTDRKLHNSDCQGSPRQWNCWARNPRCPPWLHKRLFKQLLSLCSLSPSPVPLCHKVVVLNDPVHSYL